ncbi:NUDIX hydrolase [Streptomyces sp. CC77]|uniref:NUDIX hydrolase n=1 Tax=Streptomyces sp. CC77 TaxID=1906739 RepID=UPI0008DE774A|nr:NUDIX hydrolase [Streptomyces sp. CC77]OII67093.1 DNA mismatch repair protein MutT [Streptomyces sp. CC77]
MTRGPVEAAGCVLWREAASGGLEVCLVHRPEYDDWSLPKGKLKRGETREEAAVREVREETGHTCALGGLLGTVHYTAKGRAKEVTYWAARATGGVFVPNREVDAVAWRPPAEAEARLTHPLDRPLVRSFVATLG